MEITDFKAEAIIQQDGKIANLIYPSHYPWTVCQVIPVHDQKELDLLRLHFSALHLPMYFAQNGDKSFFVVQASGCTPGKRLNIDQTNHSKVYHDIRICLQAAADWWSELGKNGKCPASCLGSEVSHYSISKISPNLQISKYGTEKAHLL